MVVVIYRNIITITKVQTFLYSSLVKNGLVFYSFLAIWFNVSPSYFKFLVLVDSEFKGVGMKAPNFYFWCVLSVISICCFVLALPNASKKQFLFGTHSLSLVGFDIFKQLFWSQNSFCWVVFRKFFSNFSVVLLLLEKIG